LRFACSLQEEKGAKKTITWGLGRYCRKGQNSGKGKVEETEYVCAREWAAMVNGKSRRSEEGKKKGKYPGCKLNEKANSHQTESGRNMRKKGKSGKSD